MGNNSGLLSSLAGWNGTMYTYASGISDSVVKPIAYTLLALFFLLELWNLSQRLATMGGGQTVGVQQLCLSMLKMVLCKWAVDSAMPLVNCIFSVFQSITTGMASYVGNGTVSGGLDSAALVSSVGKGIGDQISVVIGLIIPYTIVLIAGMAVTVIVAARFIELYVMLAIAPLPLSTFCSQELRSIGTNYLKSFAAVCLQGALIYLAIGFFPALYSAGNFVSDGSLQDSAWAMAGYSVVLLVAVFSCGRWAKSICNAM
jgi:hypothetical protein